VSEDIKKPVTEAEVDAWIAGLSETDRQELRRQQVQHKAVTREAPKDVDWGSLSDGEFEVMKRKLFRNG
jgi:hypothetical protein